jgi:baculoviral IAP repeat-containing protein 6
MKENEEQSIEFNKICAIYEECIAFQNQLNIVKNVIKRLESVSAPEQQLPPEIPLKSLCTDKLRVLSECLIESLLHFIINYGVQNVSAMHSFFDLKTCNLLFKSLVVRGDSHLQLATCSLLVRMCCFQPWWGDFFANTFTTLFSSQNCEIFPQDRVFFLLTYLGRKSIYMGTCRTIVIDAILKTIASLLAPLSSSFDSRLGVWRNTDLILLSWLLLFLSVCLHDNSEKKENSNPRWDFMSGEADMVKARLSMNNNNSRTFSRSFKKRFLQNKQSNTNIAEKFYMMSDGSFSNSQSSLAQIEQQMKQEVKKYQNTVKNLPYDYLNEFGKNIKKISENASKSSSSSSNMNTASGCSSKNDLSFDNLPDTAFDRGLKSIRAQNMLVVIRGLIGLLLNMDFTCNMDLFLLTCKVRFPN